jgi:hypothetical protein
MRNYFTEDIEIDRIYFFVETVVLFFNKNKIIEDYLKEKKDSNYLEKNLNNLNIKVQ